LPSRHPGTEHQRNILFEFSDALSEAERTELEQEWKREFDRSWEPGFSVSHEGRIFTGQIARELHWLHVDLPPPLHAKFMAARQRRSRTILELESLQRNSKPRVLRECWQKRLRYRAPIAVAICDCLDGRCGHEKLPTGFGDRMVLSRVYRSRRIRSGRVVPAASNFQAASDIAAPAAVPYHGILSSSGNC
jgi:hypothetical protein